MVNSELKMSESAIKESDKDDFGPAAIGGVCAGVIVIGCIIVGIFIWRKKNRMVTKTVITAKSLASAEEVTLPVNQD